MENELAHLYVTFARYRPTTVLEGCRCCVSPKTSAKLVSTPLAELSEGDLSPYWSKAMTTWGTVDDFRYFLPRILELSSQRTSLIDLPWLGSKLQYASWLSWPQTEVIAVRGFLLALWRSWLSTPPEADSEAFDSLLGFTGAAEDDLSPYFALFGSLEPPNPARHVSAFLQGVSSGHLPTELGTGFLEERAVQVHQIAAWLHWFRAAT